MGVVWAVTSLPATALVSALDTALGREPVAPFFVFVVTLLN